MEKRLSLSHQQKAIAICFLGALLIIVPITWFLFSSLSKTSLPQIDDLKVDLLTQGEGEKVAGDGLNIIKYKGFTKDGFEFAPLTQFQFRFGDGTALKAWEEGMRGMKMGELRRLEIEPRLAYGEDGIPGLVPPNATVIFEIELIAIQN